MPPKVKVTKNEIIQAALDIVREQGDGALNARSVADRLGCSTQPVFSNYPSMNDLRTDVMDAARKMYIKYVEEEIKKEKYPIYKSSGMAYINFAKTEKELFRLLYMYDRTNDQQSDELHPFITGFLSDKFGISHEEARMFHLKMWVSVHGLAVLQATSFLELPEDTVSEVMTDIFLGLVHRNEIKKENGQ